MTCSISDVLTLLGVIIALQALACAFHWKMHARYKNVLDEEVARRSKNSFYIENGHTAMREALVEIDATTRILSSLIARLVDQDGNGEMYQNVCQALGQYQDRRTKTLLDLLLLGADVNRRRSAIRQLSQANGDLQSYELMILLNKEEGESDSILQAGISAMKSRLDRLTDQRSD